jgi:hypothetical protein
VPARQRYRSHGPRVLICTWAMDYYIVG